MAAALELPPDTPLDVLAKEMEETNNKDPKFRTILDRAYKSALDSYTNRINKYESAPEMQEQISDLKCIFTESVCQPDCCANFPKIICS